MKTLKSRLLNEGFYKNAGGMSHPTTTEELLDEIQIRLDRGQTNLNDIDTSKITNMNYVFFSFRDNYNLENIDISKKELIKHRGYINTIKDEYPLV